MATYRPLQPVGPVAKPNWYSIADDAGFGPAFGSWAGFAAFAAAPNVGGCGVPFFDIV